MSPQPKPAVTKLQSVWSAPPSVPQHTLTINAAAQPAAAAAARGAAQRSPLSSPLYGEIMSPSDFQHTTLQYTTNAHVYNPIDDAEDDTFLYDSVQHTFIPPTTPEKLQLHKGSTAAGNDAVSSSVASTSSDSSSYATYSHTYTSSSNSVSSAFPSGLFNSPYVNNSSASALHTDALAQHFGALAVEPYPGIVDSDSDAEPYFYGSADAPGYAAYQQALKQSAQQQQAQHSEPVQHTATAVRTDHKNDAKQQPNDATTAATTPKATESAPKTWSSLLKKHSDSAAAAGTTPATTATQPQPAVIPNEYTVESASQPAHEPKPCVFFLQGICRYGAHCMNTHIFTDNICPQCTQYIAGSSAEHMLHQQQCTEAMYIQYERMQSYHVLCGICYEPTVQAGRRFGLLSDCMHSYCLECIRQYKSQDDTDNLSHTLKSCAICDAQSAFIIPSDRVIVDPQRKQRALDEYKHRLSQIPCRNYNERGSCTFGSHCLYSHTKSAAHAYPRPARRDAAAARQVKLSDFLFPDLGEAQHSSNDAEQYNQTYTHHSGVQYEFTPNAVVHDQYTS